MKYLIGLVSNPSTYWTIIGALLAKIIGFWGVVCLVMSYVFLMNWTPPPLPS